jgi:hypothetical protein
MTLLYERAKQFYQSLARNKTVNWGDRISPKHESGKC